MHMENVIRQRFPNFQNQHGHFNFTIVRQWMIYSLIKVEKIILFRLVRIPRTHRRFHRYEKHCNKEWTMFQKFHINSHLICFLMTRRYTLKGPRGERIKTGKTRFTPRIMLESHYRIYVYARSLKLSSMKVDNKTLYNNFYSPYV